MYIINCQREHDPYFGWIPTKVRMNGFTICELKGGECSDFWSDSEKTYLEVNSKWLGKAHTKIVGIPEEGYELRIKLGINGLSIKTLAKSECPHSVVEAATKTNISSMQQKSRQQQTITQRLFAFDLSSFLW